jgi:CheY-like chemotaxis protein
MEKSTGAKILVIGDDSNFCYLMRRYVRQSLHQIAFAYMGEDALALAKRENPSAIIIEVDVPGSPGWSVLKALKSDEGTCGIPVLLCSWKDDDEEYRAADLKAEVHLRKPVLYEDFVTALNQIGIPAELK